MIRTCPKCGDYYMDALLAFCLADGTPLINVASDSTSWSNAAQIIAAKEQTLKKRKRKLKWQRIVMSMMAVATLAMLGAAFNTLIYIESVPKKDIASQPSIPGAGPTGGSNSVIKTTSAETLPTPSPNPTTTPKTTTIATETPTRETMPLATPTPKQTPVLISTPTQNPATTPTIFSTPVKPPECSAADKSQEKRVIVNKFDGEWRRNIEGDRHKISAENLPAVVTNAIGQVGIAKPEVILGAIEYESVFPQMCMASITARYVWQVRINRNGVIKVLNITGQKKFACVKAGETWRCS
jgi:hypothetical protein